MATEVSFNYGVAVVWADTTDYSSTISGLVRTAQIDLTSIGAAAARQGAKVDLGDIRPRKWLVSVGIEFDVAPSSADTVEFYWAGSPSSTAGNANPGGTTGADAAYSGTAGDSLADSLPQLQFIGALIATADAATVVQYQTVGVLEDVYRFGMPVVFNNADQAFEGDAVEMFVALTPLQDEIRD